jgi:hypothetical protein
MQNRINYLLYFTLFIVASNCFGQTGSVNAIISRIISPSPTPAALGKYEDAEVNQCTGIPSISIPLYKVKTNDYSLPISLSYHAGGIRVEDRASWVGLGWSLNAGGIITRTVRGKPDESGYTGTDGALIPANGNVSQYTHDGFLLLKNSADNVIDLQPDEYFFNFAGYAGKFVISPDGSTHLIPASSIKIVLDNYARKPRFTVTTNDGIIYTFTATETTEPIDLGGDAGSISPYVSTWYLTSVVFPNSPQSITFQYASYTSSSTTNYFYNERWQVLSANGGNLVSSNISRSKLNISGLYLSKIIFPEGSIEFIPKNEIRQDIAGDKILEYIKVYDDNSALIKTWKFDYTYYNNASSDVSYKRLRLEKIQELGVNGGLIPPYTFTYNSIPLPSINSFAQDHWGFYNGKNNSKLIPAGKLGTVIIPGADRNIDTSYSKAGILEKMSFPTGGLTTFQFEGNTQYADEKKLVDVAKSANCNSGPNTNEPYNCTSESAPFTFANAVGDISVYVDRQVQTGNTANVFLRNITTGATIPLYSGPSYLLTGIDRTQTYKITTETYHEGGDVAEFIMATIQWKEYDNNSLVKSKPAPGLRIKKIVTTDGVDASTTKVTSYVYDMFNDAGRSSGHISGAVPTYEYPFSVIAEGSNVENFYVMRFSKSQADLGGSDYIFYGNVKKIVGSEAQNGSVNSYFGVNNGEIGCANNFFPFVPCTSSSYKNLLMTRQVTLNNIGKIIQDDVYTYYFDPSNNYFKIPGFVAGYTKRNYNYYGATQQDFISNTFTYSKYDYISEWHYLKTKSTTLKDQSGSIGSSIAIFYEYGNPVHMQTTAISTILENAGANTQRASYVKRYFPHDYTYPGTLSGTATALKTMLDKHIWNTPVEQLNYSIIGSVYRLIGGELTTFKMNGTSIVRDKDYSVKCNGSTIYKDLISVTPSSINSSGQFIYDSHYEQLNSYKYDLSNNLVELTDRKNTSSLIREPNTGYVWAKTINSVYGGIAYSSFEHTSASTFTNWNYNLAGITPVSSQTGLKAFNLSGNPINTLQPLVTTQKYKVSFWRKVGSGSTLSFGGGSGAVITSRTGPVRNGWQYFEVLVNNATSFQISGNYIIDELRLYPQNAKMISYVFKTGVGPISQCNENNQTSFWEYDEFNRLKLTKDQDGNILKKNEYQYQVQY